MLRRTRLAIGAAMLGVSAVLAASASAICFTIVTYNGCHGWLGNQGRMCGSTPCPDLATSVPYDACLQNTSGWANCDGAGNPILVCSKSIRACNGGSCYISSSLDTFVQEAVGTGQGCDSSACLPEDCFEPE